MSTSPNASHSYAHSSSSPFDGPDGASQMVTDEFRLAPAPDCRRCVRALHLEVGRLPGVERIEVAPGESRMKVTSRAHLSRDALAVAVAESGHELFW